MAKDLLFEIGLEEMPARFMPPALAQLAELTQKALDEANLAYESVKTYGTPRRLTLIVSALAEQQPDTVLEVKGPAKKAAFDEEGNPSKALQGFCRSQGVTADDLVEQELKGVIYMYAKKEQKGQATAELLPAMLENIVHKLYFPKPMRWAYEEMRFARPIRWMVLLFGADVLPLEMAKVKADRFSRGHRFLGSDHIEIADAAEYMAKMEENFVIVDQKRRREMCWAEIQAAAEKISGVVKPDEELLEEVTYILEYPTGVIGRFDEKFLAIPTELVVTPMREHQRYFPVYDKDGKLLPNFITLRNGNAEHVDVVANGNERVLTARLSDAAFFWQEDCKHPLENNAEKLTHIVFHEKLGTLSQKVERIGKLAAFIGEKLAYPADAMTNTARAAELAKCDLVSHAVFEFTELQGIMGKYYARVFNEAEEVAAAIEEHYLPRFAGDVLPQTKAGIAIALADRLDSLVGFFAQNMIPTGSQDPYALRRQATGVAQIIIQHKLPLSVSELVAFAYANYTVEFAKNLAETQETVASFFAQRLDNILSEAGIGYDVVNAILANDCDRLCESYDKALAIAAFRTEDGFEQLMSGFTRATNLLKDKEVSGAVDEALLQTAEEKDLFAALQKARAAVDAAGDDYKAALAALGAMRPQIDAFFDNVMVMVDDLAVRANRLSLLAGIVGLVDNIGKLDRLVVK